MDSSSRKSCIDGVVDEPYWFDEVASQPYTMAGIGLTGEDEDPCKIDKIKSRELNDDDTSKESGSGTTINTTEEVPSSFHFGEITGFHWDDEVASHPYTMAGIGLTGEDEDPCKIDKIKSRESENSPVPGGNFWGIRYASEADDNYLQFLKNQAGKEDTHDSKGHSWKEEGYHHQDHSREDGHHHKGHSREDQEVDEGHRYPRKEEKPNCRDYHFYAAANTVDEAYKTLIKVSYDCFVAAQKLELYMLDNVFKDRRFGKYNWMLNLRTNWIPTIPDPVKPTYINIDRNKFFLHTFVYTLHCRIGLKAMANEQIKSKGPLTKQFTDLKLGCNNLVKTFKDTMSKLKIPVGADVKIKDNIMPVEHRNMITDYGRSLRDYSILIQYIKNTNHISKGLCFLRYEII